MINDKIKDRIANKLSYYYKYAINFHEISYEKNVQASNFQTYKSSICDESALFTEYNLCLKNEKLPYAENINIKHCNDILLDVNSCTIVKNELEKVFQIRQRKYINDKYFKYI